MGIAGLRRIAAVAVVAVLGAGAAGQEETDPVASQFEAGRAEASGEREYPYRLLRPPQDAEAPAEGWPLVVFLHGAGERGSDNAAQLRHFPERMAEPGYRERFPCFLLAVQCPEGESWADYDWRNDDGRGMRETPTPSMRAVMAGIERLVADEPIDLRRVYLTGLSMGGFGSWDLAARKPGWFAAVAPVCGGGDPQRAAAYAGLPIWAWHDEGDPVVPVELSREMVEAAEGAGAGVKYTETTGHGHTSWVPAYDADAAPAWMFEQRRGEVSEELSALREDAG